MKADRFFSVPYDNRNDTKMAMLRYKYGFGGYGRWIALLGILYDEDGLIDINDELMREMVSRQLELDDVDVFFGFLAHIGLIEPELYEMGHVVNHGVCDELEYHRRKSEAGKKGMQKRWKDGDSTC